jgi:hypothetical protein
MVNVSLSGHPHRGCHELLSCQAATHSTYVGNETEQSGPSAKGLRTKYESGGRSPNVLGVSVVQGPTHRQDRAKTAPRSAPWLISRSTRATR